MVVIANNMISNTTTNNNNMYKLTHPDIIDTHMDSPLHTPNKRSQQKTPDAPRVRRMHRQSFDGIIPLRHILPPAKVMCDMPFGLESISCELAIEFYNTQRNTLIHITNRRDVEILYMRTWKKWVPPHLQNVKRHTSQVLYALSHYVRACNIKGDEINWYHLVNVPTIPLNYPNQNELVNHITMSRGSL